MGEGVGTGAPGKVCSRSSAPGSKEALVQHVLGERLGHRIIAGRSLRSVKEVSKLKGVVAESQGPFHLCNKYFAT